MPATLPYLIALLTAAPFVVGYYVWRAVVRVRLGRWLREPRAWRNEELAAAEAEWLAPGWDAGRLPEGLSAVEVAAVWAAVDPPVARAWRFGRGAPVEKGPLPDLVRSLWESLPAADRERTEGLLRQALARQETAWSGAESGWTGQPYLLPVLPVKKRDRGVVADLRVDVEPDLTSAPAPGPLRAADAAEAAPGWMLPLLLALQRRAPVRRLRPLAALAGAGSPVAELGGQIGSRVGSQVGARVGSVLGPLGSLVGQYVGGMLGASGAKGLAAKATAPVLPELEQAELSLTALGRLARGAAFDEAAREPERHWLELGTEWERQRQRRRGLAERFWPGAGLALAEECLRLAADELRAYRHTLPLFLAAVERADPLQRGGILLQNSWLAADLPDAPEAISAARASLNRAAWAVKQRARQ